MTSLVLVSGSYSTGAAWGPIIKHLPESWTIETVTLPGYHGVPDPRTPADPDVMHLRHVVTDAVGRQSGPIHIAGHSFGFQAICAALVAGEVEVASLTSFEGNLLEPLHHDGQGAHLAGVRAFADRFMQAVHAGDPDAPGLVIDFWGVPGAWAAMPDHHKDFIRTGAAANLMDWLGALAFRPDLSRLARHDGPIAIVRGEHANPAMVAICDHLSALGPQATLDVVAGATHFLVTTHPAECAALLAQTVERAENP